MGKKKFSATLKGLEIISFNLNQPVIQGSLPIEVNFTAKIETKVLENQRLLISMPKVVFVSKQNEETIFASLTIALSFEIEDFTNAAIKRGNDRYDVDPELEKRITIKSLDTLRGVAFVLLKATYLSNVTLPLIDEDKLIPDKVVA